MAKMRQQAPNQVSKLLRETAQLRQGDTQLWHSVTEFDLSDLDILTTTIGPRGKTSFTEQFEQTAEDLMDMTERIIYLFAEQ